MIADSRSNHRRRNAAEAASFAGCRSGRKERKKVASALVYAGRLSAIALLAILIRPGTAYAQQSRGAEITVFAGVADFDAVQRVHSTGVAGAAFRWQRWERVGFIGEISAGRVRRNSNERLPYTPYRAGLFTAWPAFDDRISGELGVGIVGYSREHEETKVPFDPGAFGLAAMRFGMSDNWSIRAELVGDLTRTRAVPNTNIINGTARVGISWMLWHRSPCD
jgi:hypothetical protein